MDIFDLLLYKIEHYQCIACEQFVRSGFIFCFTCTLKNSELKYKPEYFSYDDELSIRVYENPYKIISCLKIDLTCKKALFLTINPRTLTDVDISTCRNYNDIIEMYKSIEVFI